jgi:DNA polymerase
MIKEDELLKLKKQLLIRDPTPELRSSATQLVFGGGNSEAKIMFIGEAPGKQEDLQGKPFVGASGRFLDELLASANINRDEVYITNIVKYRPPNNRDPSAQEKTALWPFLLQQIAIIRPDVIVTLGKHSGSAFIPELRIGVDHGKLKKCKVELNGREEEVSVLPLYHPAAALYNGSLRQTLFEDFHTLTNFQTTHNS